MSTGLKKVFVAGVTFTKTNYETDFRKCNYNGQIVSLALYLSIFHCTVLLDIEKKIHTFAGCQTIQILSQGPAEHMGKVGNSVGDFSRGFSGDLYS